VVIAPSADSGTSAAAVADLTSALADMKAQTANIDEGEKFVSFNALGLTIERVFKQPVAVAFEGIEYEADWEKACSGGVDTVAVSAHSTSVSRPTAR
jgi:hypothetical protein